MKRLFIGAAALLMATCTFAQSNETVTKKNSWLKAGVSAGVPVGKISDFSSFTAGVELSGQFMQTPHFGLGLATGYTHFFAKKPFEDFGTIPVGLMLRYYPQSSGVFIGTDVGYSFVTNSASDAGGFYVKPQLGYHNYDWNIYGFYNQVFQKSGYTDLQNVGIAATYNIRFN
jgi:hypothetical protein